jgi:1,4-alpha-glucan branching enzyme
MTYAFTENFMLPLSHDEVVYGKQSILGRMPGDEWQRFANLRLLYGYMYTHPGAKLLFMGGEFGQGGEWNFQQSLDWHLLQYDYHQGIQLLVSDVNALYRSEPALHQKQFSSEGFEWIDYTDAENSVLAYIRKGNKEKDAVVVIANMTPMPRDNYRVGMSKAGSYKVIFNSDEKKYGGSGFKLNAKQQSEKVAWHFRDQSISLDLPPLSVIVLKAVQSTKKS